MKPSIHPWSRTLFRYPILRLAFGFAGWILGVNEAGVWAQPGRLDPSFPVGEGPNGPVRVILELRSGSILAGGSFTRFSGTPAPGLARLDATGKLDPTFQPGVPEGQEGRPIIGLVEGADGGIYVLTENVFRTIYRLLPGGAVDTAYAGVGGLGFLQLLRDGSVVGTTQGGISSAELRYLDGSGALKAGYPKALITVYLGRTWPGSVVSAALDSEQRLIVTGSFSTVAGEGAPGVARFDVSGRLEQGFGMAAAGVRRGPFWPLPDGRIVVPAYVEFPKAATRLALSRNDGTLDPAFDTTLVLDAAKAPDRAEVVNTVVIQPDGKLLVGGPFATVNGKSQRGLARFQADGKMDQGFEIGEGFSMASPETYASDMISTVALQSSGDVLVGGAFVQVQGTPRAYLARVRGGLAVGLPVIQTPPHSTTNHETLTATFSVLAESTEALAYQWLFQRQAIPGATNATLVLQDLRSEDAGEYVVQVRNSAGITESLPARLVVIPASSPTVTVAVSELQVSPGTSPELVATVRGSPPPAVQWTRNGVAWPGGTHPILTLANIRAADAGTFRAEVSNFMGTARSEEIRVEVTPEGRFPGMVEVAFAADAFDVQALAVDAEDRILIGGGFTDIQGQRRGGIARLRADGTLDPTFDPGKGFEGGVYQCCLRVGYSITSVKAIVVQPDGHLVVAGNFSSYDGQRVSKLVRLDASGRLDTEFSTFAVVTGDDVTFLTTLAQQMDGRILGAGKFKVPSAGIARWLPEGHLDREFQTGSGFGGGAFYAPGGYPPVPSVDGTILYALQVQSDGRILVGGDFAKYNGTARRSLVRLQTNGTLDTTFAPNLSGIVQAVAAKEGGEVLVALGIADTQSQVRQLRADGTPDPTFLTAIVNGWIYAMARQTDGSVLFGGHFREVNGQARRGIARLRSNGELDSGFSLPIEGDSSWVMALLPMKNEDVMVGGYFTSVHGVPRVGLGRLQGGNVPATAPTLFQEPTNQVVPAGRDVVFQVAAVSGETPRFGWLHNGRVLEAATNAVLNLKNVVEASAGAYQAVVSNAYGSSTSRVVRLVVRTETPKPGSVDLTFRSDRLARMPLAWLGAMAIDSENRLAVVGTFTDSTDFHHGIERWLPDGTVDPAFRKWTSGFGAPEFALFQPDGRLLMTYAWESPGIPGFTVARLTASGEHDPTLRVSLAHGLGPANVHAAALDADGRILVGGEFDEIQGVAQAHVARLSSDGVVDRVFAPRLTRGSAPLERVVQCLAIQTDGRVLIAGNFGSVNGQPVRRLVRLMADGRLDDSFRVPTNFDASVLCLRVQSDGRILVGCFREGTIQGADPGPLWRLNPDGTIDETFRPAQLGNLPGYNIAVRAIIEDGAGGLLVGGDFVAGTTERPYRNLARLMSDGSLDTTWNASPGTDSTVTVILMGSSGEVYVGGSFTEVQGLPRLGVARLLASPRPLRLGIEASKSGHGDIALTVPTRPWVWYRVQEAATLTSAEWTTVGAPHLGDGTPQRWVLPSSANGQRFFRVVRD